MENNKHNMQFKRIDGSLKTFFEMEKEIFQKYDEICEGNISKIAKLLGISRTRVYRKLKIHRRKNFIENKDFVKWEKPKIIENFDLRQVGVGEDGALSVGGFVEEKEFSQRIGLEDVPLQESINLENNGDSPALPENVAIINDHLDK